MFFLVCFLYYLFDFFHSLTDSYSNTPIRILTWLHDPDILRGLLLTFPLAGPSQIFWFGLFLSFLFKKGPSGGGSVYSASFKLILLLFHCRVRPILEILVINLTAIILRGFIAQT